MEIQVQFVFSPLALNLTLQSLLDHVIGTSSRPANLQDLPLKGKWDNPKIPVVEHGNPEGLKSEE